MRSAIVYSKKIDSRWYIVKKNTRYAYILNTTAGQIWDLTILPISIEKIIRRIAKMYSLDKVSLSSEIRSFIVSLIREGYIDKIR